MLQFSIIKMLSSNLFLIPFIGSFYITTSYFWSIGILLLTISSMLLHSLELSQHFIYDYLRRIDHYLIFFLNLIQINNIILFLVAHIFMFYSYNITRKAIFTTSYIYTFYKTIVYKPNLILFLLPSILSIMMYFRAEKRGYFFEHERFLWHLGASLTLFIATYSI